MIGPKSYSAQNQDLLELDELLEDLRKAGGPQCKPLHEHLESARVYLVGRMPGEYALSLQLAGEALDGISDGALRARIATFIDGTKSKKHAENKDSSTSTTKHP